MSAREYPQVKNLRHPDAFLDHVATLGVSIPYDRGRPIDVSTLSAPLDVAGRSITNRFCVLPMEGWDGTEDGRPTDLVRRRWTRFGSSGAGLVWGGEAFAVRADGRANPHQLCMGPSSAEDLAELHGLLDPSQVTGLQLTHSGRWSVESRPARTDALLDARRTGPLLTDDERRALVDDYVRTAVLASQAGFDFVDVKICHGYLLHEVVGGAGSLEERVALPLAILDAVRAEGIAVGVRLSAFDVVPHRRGADGVGEPEVADDDADGAPWGFNDPVPLLDALGVDLVCVTAGSPYYCPHVQRPAYFPPSDGYDPPEDPLVGVARLLDAARSLKAARPEVTVVATGLSYLQEHVGPVAAAMVAEGWADVVGLGRMMLSYPELPTDVLAGADLDRRLICRTFSDCTTAPRNGLVSGCWPLDPFYKSRPDRPLLAAAKRGARV